MLSLPSDRFRFGREKLAERILCGANSVSFRVWHNPTGTEVTYELSGTIPVGDDPGDIEILHELLTRFGESQGKGE